MAAAESYLWGFHPIVEAIRAQRRKIFKVLLAREKNSARRETVAALAREAGIGVRWVTSAQLTTIMGHRRHQGLGAEVSDYPLCTVDDILTLRSDKGEDRFVLILDQIVDPQNLGALTRTAHCAGLHGVIMAKDRSAPPSATVSKASAGALEHIRLARVTNLVGTIKELKKAGLWIAGADRGADQDLFCADLTGPLALVIGGEEKGLRPLVKRQCDLMLAIPQTGPIGSLNASVAAAVIMYEVFRQRRSAASIPSGGKGG